MSTVYSEITKISTKYPFDPELNVKIVELYKIQPSTDLLLKLYHNNIKMIFKYAKKYENNLRGEEMSIFSIFYTCIEQALKSYVIDRGMAFHNFLDWKISTYFITEIIASKDTVYLPVRASKEGQRVCSSELADVHTYIDSTLSNIPNVLALDKIYAEYHKLYNKPKDLKYFDMFKMEQNDHTFVEIAEIYEISRERARQICLTVQSQLTDIAKKIYKIPETTTNITTLPNDLADDKLCVEYHKLYNKPKDLKYLKIWKLSQSGYNYSQIGKFYGYERSWVQKTCLKVSEQLNEIAKNMVNI
jgi:hypothetical protein